MPADKNFQQTFSSSDQLWRFVSYLSRQQCPVDLKCQIDLKNKSLTLNWTEGDPMFSKQLSAYGQKSQSYTLFCDGGSRGNPGPGACGYIILDEQEVAISQGGQFFEHCTNNYAEYQSLRYGLKAALDQQIFNLKIRMDSQLIVKQVKGQYKIKHPDLLPIYKEVKAALQKLSHYEIDFIPRKYNHQADAIVNQFLDKHLSSKQDLLE